ncbi:hypothetical protein IPZ64_26615 [Streptomyces violaceoruber]|uniref:hypothetical protein n=1 Tax=Streptomyces violaceoruber TaxID=1935 RepID=UPI001F2F590B|nr:hypothetical protein [Streptomyces violaceoruber]MCF3170458.1 hypothetical protein [Streptomyces violaceoruber]
MISEPELVGEDGPGSSRDVVSGFDPEQGAAGGGRRRSGAVWAVAGALVASAVWASAVFGYGIGRDGKPDPRGYRVESDSCTAMRLPALTEVLGEQVSEPATELDGIEHPALHRIRCTVAFRTRDTPVGENGTRWSVEFGVSLTAELHKETDPRPEFEASSTLTEIDGSVVERVEPVPDLGDQAYLLTLEAGVLRLNVVEGGAVVRLALTGWTFTEDDSDDENGPPDDMAEPDLLAYRAELINDMREVMKALKAG